MRKPAALVVQFRSEGCGQEVECLPCLAPVNRSSPRCGADFYTVDRGVRNLRILVTRRIRERKVRVLVEGGMVGTDGASNHAATVRATHLEIRAASRRSRMTISVCRHIVVPANIQARGRIT